MGRGGGWARGDSEAGWGDAGIDAGAWGYMPATKCKMADGGLASPPHVPFEKYDGRMHDWRSHALLPVVKCTTGGPMNDRRPNSVPAVKYMTSGQMLVRQSNALLAVKCTTGGQMHDH